MIEYLSTKHKKSQSSASTGMLSLHKMKLQFQGESTDIVILPPQQSDRFQILNQVKGDLSFISPETEKNVRQRSDMYQNAIVKGSKDHKISFRDQFGKQKIQTIHYFYKEPEQIDDECCPCLIF